MRTTAFDDDHDSRDEDDDIAMCFLVTRREADVEKSRHDHSRLSRETDDEEQSRLLYSLETRDFSAAPMASVPAGCTIITIACSPAK